ncbi:MAG: N-acetylmuramoyl-L-alanine amidase [Gammaproteobacteria bacterium]|jgi:N-acetyl-anhydromuramyl-L-alanine amidase AmpD|nr:N-acetylmuramoyl-L-alanine amidase [Gammaproteobacteria bacterium]MBU1507406.1 N-acetylmuramoyl-L-alanine amidase [Gammaproteobacteria bacterium]MBU2122821.1 N-acetylmuramoyl-L-alanine amidase [Gammaproteobacteria bacterium]MBU2170530.1 N-acetylmuramoyl-L-alanine amidase [Gammaproteobacteria bacterium]MBU2202339.1 N-acetylmuramoyl-L-alanine amidase [Gammaproteobacteria bacterium]
MPKITPEGIFVDGRIIVRRYLNLEHGPISTVVAIVLHQTDSSTAQQTFNSYARSPHGAHFLIDKNGQVYQTASLLMRCQHVGRHIRSRCLEIDKPSCDSVAMARIQAMSWSNHVRALDAHERAKPYPQRYPINGDSIGIEIVGRSIDDKKYEAVTSEQNNSLQWLTGELYSHFSISSQDVYRHPEVSYKNPGEAASALPK